MRIIAYTYEADLHCIDCTFKWAETESLRRGGDGSVRIGEHDVIEYQVAYFHGLVYDSTVAPNPLFDTDTFPFGQAELSWAENPTQHLACGDCKAYIEGSTYAG